MQRTRLAVADNFLRGVAGGMQAGQEVQRVQTKNALLDVLAKNAGNLSDPEVMSQITAISPEMGMRLEERAYQRQRDARADRRADQRFQMDQQALDMRIAEYRKNASAEEAALLAQQIEQGLIQATRHYRAGDLDSLNAMLAQAGEEPLQSLDQFPALAATYEGVWDALSRTEPEVQKPLSPAGKLAADLASGAITPEQYEAAANDSPQVVVNTGDVPPPDDAELRKSLNKKEGEIWSAHLTTATQSSANAQDFEVLSELIELAPQGPLSGRLAEAFPGFSSAGDAFQSIVRRIAPTLRAPGSGSTSDIEYDGMLRSLPALRNDPAGNRVILQIMRAKMDINMQRGQIVAAYQNGDLSAVEARQRISEIDGQSIMTPQMKGLLDALNEEDGLSEEDLRYLEQ